MTLRPNKQLGKLDQIQKDKEPIVKRMKLLLRILILLNKQMN